MSSSAPAPAPAATAPISDTHASLLSELSSTEGQLAPTLRAVYDSNTTHAFMLQLEAFVSKTTLEIERMCNHHYQGFIESVDELLKVRADALSLREAIKRSDDALAKSGKEYLDKAEELKQYRVILRNITSAMEVLTQCLPPLHLYGKAYSHFKAGRYYHSLTALNQLETQFLSDIAMYSFTQAIKDGIPVLRASIKSAVLSHLQDWLASIRDHSRVLGSSVLSQISQWNLKNNPGSTFVSSASNNSNSSGNLALDGAAASLSDILPSVSALSSSASAAAAAAAASSASASSNNPFAQSQGSAVTVDFTPVYQCLHIYSSFGVQDEFELYYRKARRQQANLLYQPLQDSTSHLNSTPVASPSADSTGTGTGGGASFSPSLSSTSSAASRNLSNLSELFNEIAGFFIVEETVLTTTQGLITRGLVDELWEVALAHMCAFLAAQAKHAKTSYSLLEAKRYIVLFSQALSLYGYTTTRLLETMYELRQRFIELLLLEYGQKFRAIFQNDSYEPILVSSAKEYEHWLSVYPQRHPDMDQGRFPHTFPFSSSVPKVYAEVKEFVKAMLSYVDSLDLSHTETDELLRDATNAVLSKTLADCLASLVKNSSLNLSQLLQISVNSTSLADSFAQMEHHISSIMHTTSSPSSSSSSAMSASSSFSAFTTSSSSDHLASELSSTGLSNMAAAGGSGIQGVAVFKQTRSRAEDLIFTMVKTKIDDFIQLADYNWTPSEKPTKPSDYLDDMIGYLQTMFASVSQFPAELAHLTYLCACNHLNFHLNALIQNDTVRKINPFGIEQFSLDVEACETFAANCPVPHLKDTFLPLRQLVDLFNNWDFDAFVNETTRNLKYPTLQTPKVVKVLEKMKEDETKFAFKKSSRNKEIDTFLKTLRDRTVSH